MSFQALSIVGLVHITQDVNSNVVAFPQYESNPSHFLSEGTQVVVARILVYI